MEGRTYRLAGAPPLRVGGAMFAGVVLGVFSGLDRAARVFVSEKETKTRAVASARHAEIYERCRKLYGAIRPLVQGWDCARTARRMSGAAREWRRSVNKGEVLNKGTAKLRYFVKSVSFKVFLVILALVLPLNVFALIIVNNSIKKAENRTVETIEYSVTIMVLDMENKMDAVSRILFTIYNSYPDFQAYKSNTSHYAFDTAKTRLYQYISDMLTIGNFADCVFYHLEEKDDTLIWKSIKSGAPHLQDVREYVLEQVSCGERKGWYVVELNKPLLFFFTKIGNVYWGAYMDLEFFLEQLHETLPYQSMEVFIDSQNDIQETRNGQNLTVSRTVKGLKAPIKITVSKNEINGSVQFLYGFYQLMAIIALVLTPLLFLAISRLLISPLKILHHAHIHIGKGEINYRIAEKSRSADYQLIYASFNDMAENIQTLTIENYEKELHKSKFELRSLQWQIRPHFLLNTFNLLFTLAQKMDYANIQKSILYLSDYFRHIFRDGNDLIIYGKEHALIEGYIQICNVRYDSSITISYDYDDAISFVRIPPLLIHTFVENIVIHLVKIGTETKIKLIGKYENQTVHFYISDNGSGLNNEQIKSILEQMRKQKITGTRVGLANQYHRLKHFYGEAAEIALESEPGKGTTFIVRFPFQLDSP